MQHVRNKNKQKSKHRVSQGLWKFYPETFRESGEFQPEGKSEFARRKFRHVDSL